MVDLPGVGYNFHDQPSMFMSFNCEPEPHSELWFRKVEHAPDDTTDSNYPAPSPDWLDSNQTWAAQQLAIYYENRTGKQRITSGGEQMTNEEI